MGISEGNTEYRQALQELRCGINFETPHSKDQESRADLSMIKV